jgi:1-acyl-sn-glycerol-3-phosphate acyltransferase
VTRVYRPSADPTVPRADVVYRSAAGLAFAIMRMQRWRFDVTGLEHVPTSGGAVIVANHQSFWDYFTVGRPSYLGLGRPVRILAKASLFEVPVFGWLMRRARHIPVRRGRGAGALSAAVDALRAGELVLVLPEQTISRSFELLGFKSGAARMAAAAGVPMVPAASWGTHRFHTAGRRLRPRWRLPVSVRFGPPLVVAPDDDVAEATAEVRARVAALLDEAIAGYPDGTPAGAWWVPERFGGGAPHHEAALAAFDELARRWREHHPGQRTGRGRERAGVDADTPPDAEPEPPVAAGPS